MPRSELLTYLRDHLAGARGALELIEYLGDHAGDPAVRSLMTGLNREIQSDRDTLEQFAQRLGGGASPLRDASAWLAEKASRLKLGAVGKATGDLPLFEALEALALGILGKVALCDALLAARQNDPGIPEIDLPGLQRRALDQHRRVETERLRLAAVVLAGR